MSGGCVAATYALLYLLITSESYALLAAALTPFALLATAMLLTRRIDWYAYETSRDQMQRRQQRALPPVLDVGLRSGSR